MAVSEEQVGLEAVPRLVAWLRDGCPAATSIELAALLDGLAPGRARHLEQVLDDLARGCRPPHPDDLAALRALDDRLAGRAV